MADGDYTFSGCDAYGDSWNGNTFVLSDPDGNVVFSSAGPASGIGAGACEASAMTLGGDAPVAGCTDPSAPNYNPDATVDDGSCVDTTCDDCVYDWSAYGAACCDAAWDDFAIDCATLEGTYGWDCTGCACPGDEEDDLPEYGEGCTGQDANGVAGPGDGQYQCAYLDFFGYVSGGECISVDQLCDGVQDCYYYDGPFSGAHDEANCGEPVGCAEDEFDCYGDGSECIPGGYYCDGSLDNGNAGWGPDCTNGADEVLEECCAAEASAYAGSCDSDPGDGCPEGTNTYLVTVGGGSWDSEIQWALGETLGGAGTFELCLADGNYALLMVDAYGDGWNGGSFTMTDADGNVVFSSDGHLVNGISEEVNVCLGADCGGEEPTCTDYVIEVGGGSWDSEISWTFGGLTGGAPILHLLV